MVIILGWLVRWLMGCRFIFVGKTALEVFRCVERRLSYIPDLAVAERHRRLVERSASFRTFEALQSIRVGDMVVTPLLVDHSAFDAYMFIIEADNLRILHTGDFRAHGFRGMKLLEMLRKYAGRIDYLICEGTNVARPDAVVKTERDLQLDFFQAFERNRYNFVLVSSTNIDRVFALYHAAKKAGRCFVCDEYQAEILRIVSRNHKKFSSFYDMDFDRVDVPAGRIIVLKRRGREALSFRGRLKPYLVKHGFCMLIRATDAFESLLDEYAASSGFACYYSQWDGYLDSRKPAFNEALHAFLKPYPLKHLHTSGHADVQTLRAVIETVKPTRGIIPIHTDAPEAYEKCFGDVAPVVRLRDGVGLECGSTVANFATVQSE